MSGVSSELGAAGLPHRGRTLWRLLGRGVGVLADRLVAERERWPLWVPVGVGLGVASYFGLPTEPAWWVGPAALLAGLLAAGFGRRRQQALLLAGFAVLTVAVGFSAAQLRRAVVQAPVLERELDRVWLTGQIVELDVLPGARRLLLGHPRIEGLAVETTPRRVRLRLAKAEPLLVPGDWVRLRATLGPPSAPVAPQAYDFQRHAFFEGVGASGFALGGVEVLEPPASTGGVGRALYEVRLGIAQLRQAITARILAALPDETGAVAAALTTGSQSAVAKPVLEAMRDSGLAHLLSISGLHIGLVAGILFVGLRSLLALVPPLALRQPIKKWAAAAALLGSFFYLLLSGGTVPTQRSFLMTGVVLLGVMLDRSPLSMRLIAWAALVVLLLWPEAMVGPSFQMSFAAVVALIAVYEGSRDWRRERRRDVGLFRRFGEAVLTLALTSLIAGAATAPFAVYHFNRMALYGVLANLLAVPLTGLWIMPAAVLALLFMPFGLEGLALAPMGWGIEVLLGIARTVAAWPAAVAVVPAMPLAGLALLTLGGLWLCLWQRRWRAYGLVAVALGLASAALVQPPDLLISEDAKLVAVRDASGRLLLSSARAARFTGETWLHRSGQNEALRFPADGTSADGRLRCDSLGCLYRANGRAVAIVWHADALAEDCISADLVVSTEPVRRPCKALVIDRFDLWRNGGYAAWVAEERIELLSVRQARGERPWVLRRAREEAGRSAQ